MWNDNRFTDNHFKKDNRFQKSKTDDWISFIQLYVFVDDCLLCDEWNNSVKNSTVDGNDGKITANAF